MLPHIGEETFRIPDDDLSVGLIFFGDFVHAIIDGFAVHQTVEDDSAYFVDLQVFADVIDEYDCSSLLGIQGYLVLQAGVRHRATGLHVLATFPLPRLVAFQTET